MAKDVFHQQVKNALRMEYYPWPLNHSH